MVVSLVCIFFRLMVKFKHSVNDLIDVIKLNVATKYLGKNTTNEDLGKKT